MHPIFRVWNAGKVGMNIQFHSQESWQGFPSCFLYASPVELLLRFMLILDKNIYFRY